MSSKQSKKSGPKPESSPPAPSGTEEAGASSRPSVDEDYEDVIEFLITADDFEEAFGRQPRDREEFEFGDFAHYCKNGLDAQVDWDVIRRAAAARVPEVQRMRRACAATPAGGSEPEQGPLID